jgi:hypothetical protein
MAGLVIHPDYRAPLAAAGLDTFDALWQAAEGTPVDGHATRSVSRIELAGPDGEAVGVYVKRQWGPEAERRWTDLLRGRRPMVAARREWRNARRLTAAGIPVATPVAWGRAEAGKPRALIAVLEVPGPSLAAWLAGDAKPHGRTSLRSRVTRAVALLARRLHQAGWSFPDFYAKHVFLTGLDIGRPKAILIDVHRLRRASQRRMMTDDLARLYVSAPAGTVSPTDCARLVTFYLGRRPPGPPDRPANTLGRYSHELARGVRRDVVSREADERRDRRRMHAEARDLIADVLRTASRMPGRGRDPNLIPARREAPPGVVPLAEETMTPADGGRLHVNEAFRPMLEAAGLTTLDALMAVDEGETYREGAGRSTVRLVLDDPAAGDTRAVYLKRYTGVPWRTALRRTLSLNPPVSRGRQEAGGLARLADAGIASMRPVAFGGEVRRGGREECSVLVTEEIAGATQADDFCEARFAPPVSPERTAEKRNLIRQTAALARRLHGADLSHRDFYLCHVMVRPVQGREPVLHLIDLQRLTHHRRGIGRRWVVKDLAALLFSSVPGPATGIRSPVFTRTDRLRFARAYFQADRLAPEHKRLLRAVMRKAGRIARHDARKRGREGGGP